MFEVIGTTKLGTFVLTDCLQNFETRVTEAGARNVADACARDSWKSVAVIYAAM